MTLRDRSLFRKALDLAFSALGLLLLLPLVLALLLSGRRADLSL